MDFTRWRFFSKAYVTVKKDPDGMFIVCLPYEYMTHVDGEVTEGYDGSTNVIRAKWLNTEGSSRQTPPNVVLGEEVFIYRYGDLEDGYYWTTVGSTDFKLRKLEHVIHQWSDKPSQGAAKPKDRYESIMSTREGKFQFTSSNANGEPSIFQIKVNFKKGVLDFGWDTGVSIRLDHATRRMTLFGAGLTIPEGNLYVEKEATVKGDIIGKSNCKITKDVSCLNATATVKIQAPTIIGGAATLSGGGVQSSVVAGGFIAGGSVTSGGRPVKTH